MRVDSVILSHRDRWKRKGQIKQELKRWISVNKRPWRSWNEVEIPLAGNLGQEYSISPGFFVVTYFIHSKRL
ncbi:MAG: hypothetical protein COT43_12080 [Candidatus Marinimicrobia bacterium CG08_land_8_20_14_0_20_45_22]|nr:MAG: hypothetical protein COT43_12080 [Candidatus Marinimicrobia bacterium CG08_land_8_20_14_0_20_45_22]